MSDGTRRTATIIIDPELLREILQLPSHFTGRDFHYDPLTAMTFLRVDSPHLPPVTLGEILPTLRPWFRKNLETGALTLERIQGYDGPLEVEEEAA